MGASQSLLEREARKARVRESLALRGLRSNFEPPPHDPTLFSHIRNSYYLVPPKANVRDQLPLVRSLIKHNGTANADRLCAKYAFPVHSPGLKEWVEQQRVYINGLLYRDKVILRSYTKYGDALVNNYSRGTLGPIDDMLEFHYPHLSFLAYYIYDQYDELAPRMTLLPREVLLYPSAG